MPSPSPRDRDPADGGGFGGDASSAAIGHDLNGALAIIAAQAELLELETAGTPAADRAGRIRHAADRAARIVATLLARDRDAPGDDPSVAPDAGTPPAATSAARTALIVDDEPDLAESLADLLALLGFRTTTCDGGAAAKALLVSGGYDLIVSDVRMPGIDGPALFGWLSETRPELVGAVAFSTGDTLSPMAARFLAEAGRPYMEKPFTLQMVRTLVGAVDERRSGRGPGLGGDGG